jgi:hypothetical protein
MALPCFFLFLNRALAQDVLTSPPQTPTVPAAVQESQAGNPMQVFAPPAETPSPVPLQWGSATAHPYVNYQFSYGNGINSSPGKSQDTIIQTLSPGTSFNLGDHWSLNYTPTLTFYSSRNFQDTLGQSVSMGWGSAYGGDWFFSASQAYSTSSSPQVETGAQTGNDAYSTSLNASHQFTDKISMDLGLSQGLNYVESGGRTTNSLQNLADSKTWSTMDGLNYQVWSRFSVGLSASLGYNQQVGTPASIYESYQGRINWRATDKISFQVSGGLEDEQYLSGGANPLATPIFSASIQYQPVEQTQVSLTASRTVSQSSFQSQQTESTSVSVALSQRLLGRLNLSLSGSYDTSDYLASTAKLATTTSRSDDTYSFSARLSCPLLKRGSVSVFYTYTDNASAQSGFATAGTGYGFSSSQMGFAIGYRY